MKSSAVVPESGLQPMANTEPDLCVIAPIAIAAEAACTPSTVSVSLVAVLAHVIVCQLPSVRAGPPLICFVDVVPLKKQRAMPLPLLGTSSIL